MSIKALAARPTKPVPPGTFSAPSEVPLTLVAPGSQIFDGLWRTVWKVLDCRLPHGPMCTVFLFTDQRSAHLPLSAERWVRHPVDGAR